MAAGKKRYKGATRDGRTFVALPHQVLNSTAYMALSWPARSLLVEVALQFHGDDNGRMLLSRAHLEPRGWTSADVLQRAKNDLLNAGFIFETAKGHRPNKASWYALTWLTLDRLEGFDPGATAAFERSAYMGHQKALRSPIAPSLNVSPPSTAVSPSSRKGSPKNASLIPEGGTGRQPIAPGDGTEWCATVPGDGAMRAVLGSAPVPGAGHPLEKPSVPGV